MGHLFKNRLFRWLILSFAGLLLLIVLFYAEEDFRGWHAWLRFRHLAKGERFNYTDIVPAPVPDAENFALAPVVASCYAKVLNNGKALAHPDQSVVNQLDLNLYGKADSRRWPTNGNWNRGTFTDLKAWQDFYRATPGKSGDPGFPTLPQAQTPALDVLLALSKFDSTIGELREAAQLPYSRFPLNYDADHPFDTLLPHLSAMKRCTQFLQVRAEAELAAGQSDQALNDVKLSFRLIEATRNEPFLISHLVRAAQLQITIQPIWEGIARHQWSDAQLAAIQEELAKLDFLADGELAMRGERNGTLATIDRLRRHRSYRELTGILGGDPNAPKNRHNDFKKALLYHLIPAGWFYQNEVALGQLHQQWVLPVMAPDKHQVFPALADRSDKAFNALPHRPWNMFAGMFLPPLSSAERKFAYNQEIADLANLACALERYHLAHGEYPPTLDTLAPRFIEKIPDDIVGGDALHYHLAAGDQFVLYSVGWNGVDDHGQIGLQKRGGLDPAAGDWTWPIAAN